MTIIDLSKMIGKMGSDDKAILKILQKAYKDKGDEGVVSVFKEMSGVKIECLRKGAYIFKNTDVITEAIKFIDQEHRKLHNFAKRLEYAINKYFNVTRKDFGYTGINYTYNHSGVDDLGRKYNVYRECPISFCFNGGDLDQSKVELFVKELERLNVNHFICYDLTLKQAEELLYTIKSGFIRDDVEKYNL